ncbi:MAG: hypothetical protein RLZZ352_217 [Pseudomonadota bacterium]|jgi:hypothetical protein
MVRRDLTDLLLRQILKQMTNLTKLTKLPKLTKMSLINPSKYVAHVFGLQRAITLSISEHT